MIQEPENYAAQTVQAETEFMEVGPDGYREKRITPPCAAHDCDGPGTQLVVYEAIARWPSGRVLRGCVRVGVQVCEEHFEKLARGDDVIL